VDHQFTGRVERVDTEVLHNLMAHDIIPVIPPLGGDGEGNTYRLNSDAVAVEMARALRAVKLIFLTAAEGIRQGEVLLRHLSVEEAEGILKKHRGEIPPAAVSKLENAVRAARGGVPRVHIIDGRLEEGLLAEVFSNEGIGTLVHTNEYQAVRRAQKKDVRAIYGLIHEGMVKDELVRRTKAEIERQIEEFFLFEVDRNPVACVAVHFYPAERKAELACVCVDSKYENQGIGSKLVQFAEAQAKAAGASELFCLSTQAFNYFLQKGGFSLGGIDDLPPARRERYERNGRHSQILTKKL
jgi:amino-acid N-acetyltransferase